MLARSVPFSAIAITALLLLGSIPAHAAGLIRESARSVETASFDDAARHLGYAAWGTTASGVAGAHLVLTLTGRDVVLTVTLPGRSATPASNAWFRGLADRIGWSRAALTHLETPGDLTYRAEHLDGAETTGLGRSRFALDLQALSDETARITQGPALLGVRCLGADEATVVPAPVAQGHSMHSGFLFFDLRAGTAGSLRVGYGMAPRSTVAVVTTYLLILLSIPLALVAVREIMARRVPLDAAGRLALYQRWSPRALLPLVLGTTGMVFTGTSRFVYLLSTLRLSGHWLLWLIFLPFMGWVCLSQCIGSPLRQAVLPAASSTLAEPTHIKMRSIGGLGAMLGFLAVSALLGTSPPPFRFGRIDWTLLAGTLLLCGALVRRGSARGGPGSTKPVFGPEPDAPETLAAEVIRVTGEAGYRIDRVILRQPYPPERCNVFVSGGTAALPGPLVEFLPPEQWGLLTTTAVSQPDLAEAAQRRRARLRHGSCLTFLLAGTVVVGFMFATGVSGVVRLLVVGLAFGGMSVWSQFALRRGASVTAETQHRTDLRIAESLPEPQLLVFALRALEEAAARTLPSAPSEITHRRRALEQALGIESNPAALGGVPRP